MFFGNRPYRQPRLLGVLCPIGLMLLICFALHSPVLAADKTVRLATLEWPPFVGEDLKHLGFTSEIVTRCFQAAGYRVRIDFMPWARVLKEVAGGRYHAMYPAYYSNQRAVVYALSKPLAEGPLGFYKRAGEDIHFRNLSDLKPYRIGVVRGYVNTPEFDAATYLKKRPVNSDIQNLKKLLKGRIDLAIADKYTVQYLLTTALPRARGKIVFLTPPLAIKPLFVGFSREIDGYQEILADFNESLDGLAKKGIIDHIMKRHGFD